MSVVVKWREDGTYLQAFAGPSGRGRSVWGAGQRDAMRFDSQVEMRKKVAEHMGGWPEMWDKSSVAVVRLASNWPQSQPTAAPSEPTARDAVAGMLLRRGLRTSANDICHGASPADLAADLRRYRANDVGIDACIAALEALDRGDLDDPAEMRAMLDSAHQSIAWRTAQHEQAEAARDEMRRERDEARAEAAALREEIATYCGGDAQLSALRREHQTDDEQERAAPMIARWQLHRGRLSAAIERHDLSAFARGYVNGCRDTYGMAEADVMRERRAASAPEAPPLRPAEDVAREMVKAADLPGTRGLVVDIVVGDDRICLDTSETCDLDDLEDLAEHAREFVARLIERSRAEGTRAAGESGMTEHDEAAALSRLRAEMHGAPEPTDPEERSVSRWSRACAALNEKRPMFDRGYLYGMRDAFRVAEGTGHTEPAPSPENIAAAERAVESNAMRIEKRWNGEYLVNSGYVINDCQAKHHEKVCHYHFNGEHISTGTTSLDGELIVARWPIASAQDERREAPKAAAGDTAGEDIVTGFYAGNGTEVSYPREADPDAIAVAAAWLAGAPGVRHPNATAVLHSDSAGVRVTFPRKTDPRAVLATVAELLGLPSGETALDDKQAEHLREWGNRTPDEIAEHAERVDAELPRHGSWLRGVAAGIREGERRAAVQIPDLITRTHSDGVVEGERRAKAKAAELVRDWYDRAIEAEHQGEEEAAHQIDWCVSDVRAAFGLIHGQPPTGGEPTPKDAPLKCRPPTEDEKRRFAEISERLRVRYESHGRQPSAHASDERWQPGAVWERLGIGRTEHVIERSGESGTVRFLGGMRLPCADMTPANGWRYVGRSAPDGAAAGGLDAANQAVFERATDAAAEGGARPDPDADPVMRALENALIDNEPETEAERAAMQQPCPFCRQGRMSPAGARSWPTCDTCGVEQIGPGIQRADVMSGVAQRAHADGIVEGLTRLAEIVKRSCDLSVGQLDALDAAIREASANVTPADRPHVDRAALLELATGWETEAGQFQGYASPGADGLEDHGKGDGLVKAAADLRRLLDAPRVGVGQ